MKEQLIEFETAKLAKEKGFDEYCEKAYYIETNNEVVVYDSGSIATCYAPTQSLLQKWLREEHSIIVWNIPFIDDFICVVSKEYPSFKEGKIEYRSENGKWEEVLELGLQKGLNLI